MDSLGTALTPFALWAGDGLRLDRYVGGAGFPDSLYCFVRDDEGHWRNSYPPGASLVAAPLYWPLALASEVDPIAPHISFSVAGIAEKYAAATIAALAVLLLFDLLRKSTSIGRAALLAATFAVATPIVTTAGQSLLQHGPAMLVLLGSIRLLLTANPVAAAAAGLLAALLPAIRPPDGLFALALAFFAFRRGWRIGIPFGLVALVGGLLFLMYNVSTFGHPVGGYQTLYPIENVRYREGALLAMLLGPRGLAVYCPFLLLLVGARRPSWLHRSEVVVAALAWIGVAAFHAFTFSWWGGQNYGARFFLDGMPILFLLGARALEGPLHPFRKAAWIAAVAWSVSLQAVGAVAFPHGESGHASDAGSEITWSLTRSVPRLALLAGPAPVELRPLSAFGPALPLPEKARRGRIELDSHYPRYHLPAGRTVLRLRVTNPGPQTWQSAGGPLGENAVELFSLWRETNGAYVRHSTFSLGRALAPGESREIVQEFLAPREPGFYLWTITLSESRLGGAHLFEMSRGPHALVEVVDSEATLSARVAARSDPAFIFRNGFEEGDARRWSGKDPAAR